MADLTKLEAKADAFGIVVPRLAGDVAFLKAEIEKLKESVDPELQAKLDAIADRFDASLTAAITLDDSTPDRPVEPPVEG